MNRGQIRARALEFLRESTSDPVRWTINEVNRYIYDGYTFMAELSGAITRTDTLTANKEQVYVSLPQDVLFPIALKDVTSDFPIDPVNYNLLDKTDPDWTKRSDTRPTAFAAFGLYEICLYPAYNANAQTMSLISAIVPADFTSDTDEPNLPEEHHETLLEYVKWRTLLRKCFDKESEGLATEHKHRFFQMLGPLKTWGNTRHEGIATAIYGERLRSVPTAARARL